MRIICKYWCLAFLALLGCQQESRPGVAHKVVLTTPVLAWMAAQLVAQDSSWQVLQVFRSAGRCLHDHEVSVQELRDLCSASLVVANGAGLEPNLYKAMQQCPQVRILEAGSACAQVFPGQATVDPHLWLGRQGFVCELKALTEGLVSLDTAHQDRVRTLSRRMAFQVDSVWQGMTLRMAADSGAAVVSFHGGYAYLAHDLGLEVVASLKENEEGVNPSAKEIASLIAVIRAQGVKLLLVGPTESMALAEAVARESGAQVVRVDNMMGTLNPNDPLAYVRALSANMDLIRKGLGK